MANVRRRLFGSLRLSQPRGARAVNRAVLGQGDAVVALGRLARIEPVGDIGGDLLRVALGRVAEAAAARQFEPDEIAAGDGLAALGSDRFSRQQRYSARRPETAAVTAPRRVGDALEIAQHRDRRAVDAAQFDDLTQPAALAAGAAGTLAELAAAEDDWRHRFGRLDRDRAHAGGKGGHVEPVLAGPRTGAAAVENDRAERRHLARRA